MQRNINSIPKAKTFDSNTCKFDSSGIFFDLLFLCKNIIFLCLNNEKQLSTQNEMNVTKVISIETNIALINIVHLVSLLLFKTIKYNRIIP